LIDPRTGQPLPRALDSVSEQQLRKLTPHSQDRAVPPGRSSPATPSQSGSDPSS
jgi:hypothetical protein